MATISFIVFLPLGILLATLLKPKSQAMYWVWSLLIPILILFVTAFGLGAGDGYKTGQLVAQCLISTVCTMVVMLIVFYNRGNKKNK